jgi:hypothetical protein
MAAEAPSDVSAVVWAFYRWFASPQWKLLATKQPASNREISQFLAQVTNPKVFVIAS